MNTKQLDPLHSLLIVLSDLEWWPVCLDKCWEIEIVKIDSHPTINCHEVKFRITSTLDKTMNLIVTATYRSTEHDIHHWDFSTTFREKDIPELQVMYECADIKSTIDVTVLREVYYIITKLNDKVAEGNESA